ncbi:sulfatase family protein [Congregibacter litoralis]|uniref:Arylsulfatase A n=1 Tax=Congregibacter litoralis KT71 TaxID=314285 RepID=A4AAM5_9GAMM|nr:sulfatase-like hydrolase/transferase [Congregibacter litoralis]EAQ97102.1 Arylsulfatase A [Congregibacter litoralis KT71]
MPPGTLQVHRDAITGTATAVIVLAVLLLVAALSGASASAQAASDRHNVLVIYVDDLGFGDTGVYGHRVVKTPHIDGLAAEGIRFTQFYAPSALCSPSRAGLLTGRTPYRTGVESWIPDDSRVHLGRRETTLADLAKARGYRTAVIGKWHLNGGLHMRDVPQPRDFGFDYQYGLAAWVKNASVADSTELPRRGPMFPDNMYRNNEPVGVTDKYSAELVSDEAIGWLQASSDPFFLLLTYSEVHTPIASPPAYLDAYREYLSDEAKHNPFLYYFDWRNRPWRGRGEYYANISFLDAQLGRVIGHLRDQKILDNTLIVFSSDNGPVTDAALTPWELGMAGETGGLRGKKRFLFEGGIRVPGIIRYPHRIEAGRVEHRAVTALDIFPTLAEWLDVDVEPRVPLDGQSLWPLIDGDSFERDKALYWSIPTPDGMEFAVREGPWKMILDSYGVPRHLFDLSNDWYEVNNLLDREPAIRERLLLAYRSIRRSVENDPLAAARKTSPR